MFLPSQLDGRATYTTPAKAPGQIVPGFEREARIYTNACFLFVFSAVFHEAAAVGLYLLLLDQVVAQDGTGTMVANNDLALMTIGPTTAAGQVLTLPEEATMPEIEVAVPGRMGEACSKMRKMRGLPFDFGCIAAVSTTPGRLTMVQANTQGARFTARIQVCG
jgi:hypothetical protein